MAEIGGYSEVLGILSLVGACFLGGYLSTGVLSVALPIVGVAILVLWVGRYVLEGTADSVTE